MHRDPIAVLAGVLADADQAVVRSALATATESADERGSVRHAAELLADAAQMAATERTATWLDHLVDTGALSCEVRGRIAATDGAASLARVLRRAELAGHDPQHVLTEAVADRPLNDARSPTNVIYSRITTHYDRRLDPTGTSWTDWIPRTDNAEWKEYLTALANRAEQRATELGRRTACEEPAWAIKAFGAVPADPLERSEWEHRATTVAAYRELRGHDDVMEALGPAPQPGQPEAYAAYRAAWRTLGRPEIDREELELSDGQLRMRIRAWERELTWAPRYVSNELAGTRQAADRYRELAALRTAEVTTTVPEEQDRLQHEARQAVALAQTLDGRAAELQEVDDARAVFLAHTAVSRVKAERSKAELALRHIDDAEPEQSVTAEEWLDAHERATVDDEHHREVSEADLVTDDHDRTDYYGDVDIREVAATEPRAAGEDAVRVPSADETADSIGGARRSLAEIRAREAVERGEASQHRAAELAHWHVDDHAALDEDSDEHVLVHEDY